MTYDDYMDDLLGTPEPRYRADQSGPLREERRRHDWSDLEGGPINLEAERAKRSPLAAVQPPEAAPALAGPVETPVPTEPHPDPVRGLRLLAAALRIQLWEDNNRETR